MGKNDSFRCKECETLVQGKISSNSGRCPMCYQEFLIKLYQKRQVDNVKKLGLSIEKENRILAKEVRNLCGGIEIEEEDLFTESEEKEEESDNDYEPSEMEDSDEGLEQKKGDKTRVTRKKSILRKSDLIVA